MVGEVEILEAHDLPVVGGDFDGEDELFEHAGEEFDVGVVVIVGVLPEIVAEVPGLEGLGVLVDVDELGVGDGRPLALLCVVVDLPENGEHVDDVDDLLAVGLALGLLLIDEAVDLPLVEAGEDPADEGVLHQKLSVLLVDHPLLISALSCLHVLLLDLLLHLVAGDAEVGRLGPQQLDHVLADDDPQELGLTLVEELPEDLVIVALEVAQR